MLVLKALVRYKAMILQILPHAHDLLQMDEGVAVLSQVLMRCDEYCFVDARHC